MSYILSEIEIEKFINEGFIRIDNAFSTEIADEVLDILWKDIPFERSNPTSWTEPVFRLGMYNTKPFLESVNTPQLHNAFNQLVGENKWLACRSVGTFPIRFPSEKQANDTGKHVDTSFAGTDPENYLEWRVNVKSKGRALLMLVLYSDVSENDAPTIVYKGSHIDVARLLLDKGYWGLSFLELANKLNKLPQREEFHAIGKAGTVYLCHPFLVHSAQNHKGTNPKFMAQPPLLLKNELTIEGENIEFSPVEKAIRLVLD
jgi:hypothetical protein